MNQRAFHQRQNRRLRATLSALAVVASLACGAARANSDPLVDVVSAEGGAALGAAFRVERSPYRGAGTRHDFVPLYLYEGKYVYLHGHRLGLKLDKSARHRFDLFLSHRFESFPSDRTPPSLAGMTPRQPGADLGASYELRGDWGAAYAEFLTDAFGTSEGREFRLGYRYDWRSGRLRLRPHAMLALRDARLNNYYYGVRPEEATALRPAYEPGAGVNSQLGLYGSYDLSDSWKLLAGISATRWSQGVRASPIVAGRFETAVTLGLMYEFSPKHELWPERRPVLARVYYGKASECDVAKIVRQVCTSDYTPEQTRVAALEIGRPFVERLNDWPLDVVGFVGLLRHAEKGFQPDHWQVNAYMKGYWYGFPWSERVKTRVGLGVGVSYAHRVPLMEVRDQARRGRSTSRLLHYLDPTIDFSVGDLVGVKSLEKTFLGMGVSHRSGIFGASNLLGNVNGGSNYIYSYVEWQM